MAEMRGLDTKPKVPYGKFSRNNFTTFIENNASIRYSLLVFFLDFKENVYKLDKKHPKTNDFFVTRSPRRRYWGP